MATFGKTDIGLSETNLDQGYKVATRFQLTEGGDVSKITFYTKQYYATTTKIKCGIYDDSAGAPNALKGTSAEVTLPTSWAWVDFTFSPAISLTAGYYWLAIIVGEAGAASAGVKYNADTAQTGLNADAYADGFADPFGTPTYYDFIISIYATYTPVVVAKVPLKWTPHAAI